MTTRHSIQRARERLGLHEKRAQRVIELAYTRGKRIEDFRGGDCRYLRSLCEEHPQRAPLLPRSGSRSLLRRTRISEALIRDIITARYKG